MKVYELDAKSNKWVLVSETTVSIYGTISVKYY